MVRAASTGGKDQVGQGRDQTILRCQQGSLLPRGLNLDELEIENSLTVDMVKEAVEKELLTHGHFYRGMK